MNEFDTCLQFERNFCFKFKRSILFEELKKEVLFTIPNAKTDIDILHTFLLDDKYVFTSTFLIDVLFKTNLLKEKGWDLKFFYNAITFYSNLDEFPFMTTFEFVNNNKED